MPFDEATVEAIATLLGVPVAREPYAVRGAPVFRLAVANAALGCDVVLLLWPSLMRVDVRLGDCSIVYRGVTEVELIAGVEAIFRRADHDGYLFVSVGGRASVAV